MKKRIAVVVASDVLGGHEFQTAALAEGISSCHEVVVLLNRESFRPLFEDRGLKCIVYDGLFYTKGSLPIQIWHGLVKIRRIARVLKDFNQVVVCAGAVEASVASGISCFFYRMNSLLYIPFFYDRTVIWGRAGVVYNIALKALLNLYAQLITINAIQSHLLRMSFRGMVSVVDNEIGPPIPLALGPAVPRLIFIGRLDYQKKILELIGALNYQGNPYKEFVIIGDGPLRDQVSVAARNAIYIKIICLGWLNVHQQSNILRPTDVLILNSVIEGEPMVIRESAARGMIVLSANIPGVRGVTSKGNRFNDVKEMRCLLKATFIRGIHPSQARYFRSFIDRKKQIMRIFGT